MKYLRVCILVAVLLAGCSSISREQAEGIAWSYASQHVRPYARDSEVQNITPQLTGSIEQDGGWLVTISYSGLVNSSIRKASVELLVGQDGTVKSVMSPQKR